MQVSTRKTHWQNKRVFFATPQVIYNDLKSGICPGDKFRCLVIDEAHRARRNYAYCQIISALDDIGHKTYRLLALSATPGSKVDDVATVSVPFFLYINIEFLVSTTLFMKNDFDVSWEVLYYWLYLGSLHAA